MSLFDYTLGCWCQRRRQLTVNPQPHSKIQDLFWKLQSLRHQGELRYWSPCIAYISTCSSSASHFKELCGEEDDRNHCLDSLFTFWNRDGHGPGKQQTGLVQGSWLNSNPQKNEPVHNRVFISHFPFQTIFTENYSYIQLHVTNGWTNM